MRKIGLFIAALIYTLQATAQVPAGVAVSGLNVTSDGRVVTLTFRAEIDKKAVQANRTLVFAPVINNDIYKVSFAPVVVQGWQARISYERHAWASDAEAAYPGAFRTRNGETVDYRATVPFQAWMENSRLILESSVQGCCSGSYAERLLAGSVLPTAAPEPEPEPEQEPEWVPRTTGDTLSVKYNFVIPASQWNPDEPIYDEDRENALIVYYRVARSGIEPGFGDNHRILDDLVGAVNRILASPDSKVEKIVVAGFASPEGAFDFNDRLAWERAVSVKEYIIKNTGIRDADITLFNGSEDWRGLRALVAASDMYDRAKILDIIDNVPLGNGRKTRLEEIKKLSNGASYQYMLDNFFPKLRNGAFIRVYYENID